MHPPRKFLDIFIEGLWGSGFRSNHDSTIFFPYPSGKQRYANYPLSFSSIKTRHAIGVIWLEGAQHLMSTREARFIANPDELLLLLEAEIGGGISKGLK